MNNVPDPPRLKITIDDAGDVWIRGDERGLRYLAECCVRIIGKDDPAGHILLQWEMNNLWEGSLRTRLEFRDDPVAFEL
jgi:hypothetical protein